MSLKIPITTSPDWFQEDISLEAHKGVVVVDDDLPILGLWKGRLDGIPIKHFSHAEQFTSFVRQSGLGTNLFLVDYELQGSDQSGVDLISSLDLGKHAVLVTSRFEDEDVVEKARKAGVRVLPKQWIPYIPIKIAS